MLKYHSFNDHVAEYEKWFAKYPYVFKTELEAIKKLWPRKPDLKSLEIGCATGRFAHELNILEGIDPAAAMCAVAEKNGVNVLHGFAENLPYQSQQFDVVLMNFCISYFEDAQAAFKEAFRVLKRDGILIIGFIERNSLVGRYYETRKEDNIFYKEANFYSCREVEELLKKAGFNQLAFFQTLFHLPADVSTVEEFVPGNEKGSYIFIKASKPVM